VQVALRAAETPEAQNAVLSAYVKGPSGAQKTSPKSKAPLQVGTTKVDAKKGRITLTSAVDYSAINDADMARAIKAFEAALEG